MVRKPYKINAKLTKELNEKVETVGLYTHPDYTLYVTDTVRGRCYYSKKCITVPTWAVKHEDTEYCIYYVAHETAHAVTEKVKNEGPHGKSFMEYFKTICPEELQHYELNYKPRNAAAAGIRKAK